MEHTKSQPTIYRTIAAEQDPVRQSRLSWVKNDRMAGFVPSWGTVKQTDPDEFSTHLNAYVPPDEQPPDDVVIGMDKVNEDEGFSLFDVLDMVNPLQHIPVVSMIYREISGDEIKPISRIVGGGLFGGPVGAAGGLVNAVIEEETGQDAFGTARAFVSQEEEFVAVEFDMEAEKIAYADLPAALLSHAQQPINQIHQNAASAHVASIRNYRSNLAYNV